MLRMILLALAILFAFSWGGNLYAQEPGSKAGEAVLTQEGRQVQVSSRQATDRLLDELTEAYKQNDREKMGQILEKMQKSRQRQGRRIVGPARGVAVQQERPAGDASILLTGEEEKKILSVLDDMDRNQRRGMMNVPKEDGRVLRILTEATGAKHVVEIGTSNGYSGIWICLALKKTGGKLVTHEIDEGRASLARKNFERAGVEDLITLVMGDAHETVKKIKEPIDILFLDADKGGYADYLEKLLPLVRPGGLILAHNTSMRGAIEDYKKAVTTNPKLETLFIHKDGAGMGITLKKR